MSIPASYLGVIIIWSTTPLAIKWSSEGVGFLFGVSARMLIGALVCMTLMLLLSRKWPLHREAIKTYIAAGGGIYGAMMCTYWGAQYIPSGLISVIFGLSPIVTGVLATLFLDERGLTPIRLLGIIMGVIGLILIFGNGIDLHNQAGYGVIAILIAMMLHSISMVWVKGINAQLPALEVVNGGLLFCAPLYFLTWLIFDGQFPSEVNARAATSIGYLAVFGSVLGFMMFYYVLKHIDASRVALVTLITPMLALFIGQGLNHETITPVVWFGTACILFGMSIYQWGPRLLRQFARAST